MGALERCIEFVAQELERLNENLTLIFLKEELIYEQYRHKDGSKEIYKDVDLAKEMMIRFRATHEFSPKSYLAQKLV